MTRGNNNRCSPKKMYKNPMQEQFEARPSLLIVLLLGVCSLFGLLGVYASEGTLLTYQCGLGKAKGGATCRRALPWKRAEQIPRLLHRLAKMTRSGVLYIHVPEVVSMTNSVSSWSK